MKKIVSKFSKKLLSKQQLKTVKGGTPYCWCWNLPWPQHAPVDCPPGVPGGSTLGPGEGVCGY